MAKINLLEFFRTSRFGGVEVGMTREIVQRHLGMPDHWGGKDVGSDEPNTEAISGIWEYGGVELYWDEKQPVLTEISFKPWYLFTKKRKTQIDRWIFRTHNGPTCKRLKAALDEETIPYQDTGLEIAIFDESKRKFEVIPFEQAPADYDPLNVFGTLVLKSGVEVRYANDNSIIKVATGGSWAVKGGEQHIRFL